MRVEADYYRAAKKAGECRVDSVSTIPSLAGPVKVARYAVKDGNAAARLLLALSEEDAADPVVRDAALRLRRAYPGDAQFAAAVQAFVQTAVRFVKETRETFQSPRYTLLSRAGDCDDHARLVHALLLAGGVDAGIGFLMRGGQPRHAATMARVSGWWRWYETTVAARPGEHPVAAARRTMARREDIMGNGGVDGWDATGIGDALDGAFDDLESELGIGAPPVVTSGATAIPGPGVYGFRFFLRGTGINISPEGPVAMVRDYFADQEGIWLSADGSQGESGIEVVTVKPDWAPADQGGPEGPQFSGDFGQQKVTQYVWARARWGGQSATSLPPKNDGSVSTVGAWEVKAPAPGPSPSPAPSPAPTSLPGDPKIRRLWNKAWSLKTAWAKRFGKLPTKHAALAALAVAMHETNLGDPGGSWNGEHNWGATTLPNVVGQGLMTDEEKQIVVASGASQGGEGVPITEADVNKARAALHAAGKRFRGLHADSRGKFSDGRANNPVIYYYAFFSAFSNDVDGAAYFADAFNRGAVTPIVDTGDAQAIAVAMRQDRYYWGVPVSATEDVRIANYAKAIQKGLDVLAVALKDWDPSIDLHDPSAATGDPATDPPDAHGGSTGVNLAGIATGLVSLFLGGAIAYHFYG